MDDENDNADEEVFRINREGVSIVYLVPNPSSQNDIEVFQRDYEIPCIMYSLGLVPKNRENIVNSADLELLNWY